MVSCRLRVALALAITACHSAQRSQPRRDVDAMYAAWRATFESFAVGDDYPARGEPPSDCLLEGSCAAPPTVVPDAERKRAELDRAIDAEEATLVRGLQALPVTFRGAPAAVEARCITTGDPLEQEQARAVDRVLTELPSRVAVAMVPRAAHPDLFAHAGTHFAATCLVGTTLMKDLISYAQWREVVAHAAPAPLEAPDLPIADAHEHASSSEGVDRLLAIADRADLARVVLVALPDDVDYNGTDAANERTLAAAALHPDRVVPFVVLPPDAPVEKLQAYVARGARGLKLISGHGDFYRRHRGDLDAPSVRKLLAYCEAHGLPVLWHVNAQLYRYGFLRVLADFPKLTIVCPHFGGYLTNAPLLARQLLERYPGLSFDISLGTQEQYLRRSLEDLSAQHERWRQLILDHPDRFLFGVDMVVDGKTTFAHADSLRATYRALLESTSYDLDYIPPRGFTLLRERSHHRHGLAGLALPHDVLQRIYYDNAARLYHF